MLHENVPELLQEYGAAARKVLFDYLPDAEPRQHLYDLVSDYPRRGGRALRPTLCIATARAFGRSMDDALHTAASIELMHNAMLVHDDIQDESLERRGRPALHVTEGVPIAINVGDMLTLMSLWPLMDNRHRLGPSLSLRILEETATMARESAEGQALELGWRRDNVTTVSTADYMKMVLKKTCWFGMIHPARVGALIGTHGGIDPEPFIRFGFFLGTAFQIQDDLLNLVGDHETYGKESCGDIYEGKRTIMLIRLFEEGTASEQERLRELLGRPREQRAEREIVWVRRLMDRYDCIEHARKVAHGLAGAALQEAHRLFGGLRESRDRRFLEALPGWVIART